MHNKYQLESQSWLLRGCVMCIRLETAFAGLDTRLEGIEALDRPLECGLATQRIQHRFDSEVVEIAPFIDALVDVPARILNISNRRMDERHIVRRHVSML
jgi:hypothetical protein